MRRFPCGLRLFLIEQLSSCRRLAHHLTNTLRVALHEHALQLRDLDRKQLHLMQQRVLVKQEQLTPHTIVDTRDTRQIAERVTGVILQLFVVIASHQAHRDAVRQLRNETDQLVVLLR